MSIESHTPKNIPPEIETYFTGSLSGVGTSGKIGILHLELDKDSATGKTVIREQYSRVPLLTQRAIYLEETLPAMAYVYVLSPSGGILQGDRYRIDIALGNNTFAHVTTQGATRIYKMENNYASQIVNIKVEDESYFEYIPDQIIPFRNSKFYQEVELTIHNNATTIYSEMIVPGRVASGEKFEYDICYIKTIAKNHLGKTRFIDTVKLEPKKRDSTFNKILASFDVVGTVYVVTKKSYVRDLQYEINKKMKEFESKMSCGTSILPESQGLIVRILGKTANDVKNFTFEVVKITRNQVLGASFSGTRKA